MLVAAVTAGLAHHALVSRLLAARSMSEASASVLGLIERPGTARPREALEGPWADRELGKPMVWGLSGLCWARIVDWERLGVTTVDWVSGPCVARWLDPVDSCDAFGWVAFEPSGMVDLRLVEGFR